MRSNTSVAASVYMCSRFGIGIDGEAAQSVCNGQEHKRHDFRPISRHSVPRAENTGPLKRRTFRVPAAAVRRGAS